MLIRSSVEAQRAYSVAQSNGSPNFDLLPAPRLLVAPFSSDRAGLSLPFFADPITPRANVKAKFCSDEAAIERVDLIV